MKDYVQNQIQTFRISNPIIWIYQCISYILNYNQPYIEEIYRQGYYNLFKQYLYLQ